MENTDMQMADIKGTFTRQEISSQPEAWSAALEVLSGERQAFVNQGIAQLAPITFTGCGSTYYLALAAASLTQALTSRVCRAFPASELWLNPQCSYTRGKTLLVAISRSGETSETLRACEDFLSEGRGELLTLSCYGDKPLAQIGNYNLVLPSGQEQSVAQTRAFSTLYLTTVALACLWADRQDLFDSLRRLPELGWHLLNNYVSLASDLGCDPGLERFYWLGSGARHGLACELSLKMKEMSLTHSEPFHFMEFRHGPKSMVTPSTLVVGLRSMVNGPYEAAVLADVRSIGGRVLDIAEDGTDVRFASGLDEVIRDVLYLPVGQMIAYERSLSKGLNPDQPNNLDTVVKLPS